MRILSMSASFGKLDGDVLHLKPGLNVISAPNEWGKSTWCAFLTAMLYGVETAQRTTKGQLADKEKYMPWSGRPMEGLLRLEHQGRDITIQRRTRGRIPLGEFQAYETNSGLPIPELTAENCGEALLGVDRRVFQRTGFIRFSDLAVIPDESLWEQLRQSITGTEDGGSAELGKRLKELKNKCRTARGGLIPETQRKITGLEAQLQERRHLEELSQKLHAQSESAAEELRALQRHSRVLEYRDARANREQTEAAVQAAKDARDAYEAMENRCREIPVRRELVSRLETARKQLVELEDIPEKQPPSVLPVVMCGILCVLMLALAVFLLLDHKAAWACATAVTGVVSGICSGLFADRRRRDGLKHRTEQLKRNRRIEELRRSIALWETQTALRNDLEQARRTADETRIRLQSLVAAARHGAEEEQDDELDLSPEETQSRIDALAERMKQLQLRLGQCQGQAEHLPEQETLQRRLEAERHRLRDLEQYERALVLALNTLEEAAQELRRRFAPRITALTQSYLARLTGGHYNRLVIGQDLSIQAASLTETALRGTQWRSDGTSDQMYLALRLAVWVSMNPHGPLVLDDALVRFDDDRLASAMELLKELSAGRQIILFTCHGREKRYE